MLKGLDFGCLAEQLKNCPGLQRNSEGKWSVGAPLQRTQKMLMAVPDLSPGAGVS